VNDEAQLADLGTVWEQMGGVWGGVYHDPIHFEAGGLHKVTYAHAAAETGEPVEGSDIYALADFLSGFVPGLGVVQLADTLATMLGSKQDKAAWYLQHPAEAIRDLLS
jgi:hypothetical protein